MEWLHVMRMIDADTGPQYIRGSMAFQNHYPYFIVLFNKNYLLSPQFFLCFI